jgi:hypothetical protein
MDQVEGAFPCFSSPLRLSYEYRGNEPFTAQELDALRAVYTKLVLTSLIWYVTPLDNPKPTAIAIALRVPFEESCPPPSQEFLDAISTPATRAIAWNEDLDYQTPKCMLEFRSWLSPDSAYIFAEVSQSGFTGRGAVAVREGADWKVCPTEWIMQD